AFPWRESHWLLRQSPARYTPLIPRAMIQRRVPERDVPYLPGRSQAEMAEVPSPRVAGAGGPPLRIHLLGQFRLSRDGVSVTSVDTARLQSLLAFLVLRRAAPQSRRQLAGLIWPESVES